MSTALADPFGLGDFHIAVGAVALIPMAVCMEITWNSTRFGSGTTLPAFRSS